MEHVERRSARWRHLRALTAATRAVGRLDRWVLAIVALFGLRLVLAIVLRTTQLVERNGWYWANDDQTEYYGFARALLRGELADIYTFMGYGVLLTPFALGTSFVLQAVPLIAVVQFLLAVPASFLLYRAALRLTDRRAALLATALWLATPVLLGAIWTQSYSPAFSVSTLWLGLQISVDYASELMAIGVLVLAAGARTDASAGRGLLIGVVAGLALLTKPSNVVLVGSALVALAVWRRWRAAAYALAASAVVFTPQLVLNWAFTGDPTRFAYSRAWPYEDEKALASLEYVPRTFGKLVVSNYTGPLLLVAAVVALVVTWRRFPAARWLVVGQVAVFAVFFSPLYYSISGFLVRFMTPALPALCIAAAAALVGRRPESGVDDSLVRARPPGRLGLGVGVASLAAAVALAVFVAQAPVVPVLPVLHSMDPVASVRDGTVVVRWREPTAPAQLAYQVVRSASATGDEPRTTIAGGPDATMIDRPGPGTWWYRVWVTPGSQPDGWPPRVPLAESPPVRVVVPHDGL